MADEVNPCTLELLPGAFAVAQLQPEAILPDWAMTGQLHSVTRTHTELSIVCPEEAVPGEVKAQKGFRCLRVQGPLALSEVGILASLAQPLAEAGISIFVLSTYDTDYLMVPAKDLEAAVAALSEAGHLIQR